MQHFKNLVRTKHVAILLVLSKYWSPAVRFGQLRFLVYFITKEVLLKMCTGYPYVQNIYIMLTDLHS